MLAGRGGGGSRGPCLAGGLLGAMSISRGAAEVVTCSGGMLHGFSICASRHRGSHSMRTQWVRLTPNVLCICVKCVAVCEHRLHGLARVHLAWHHARILRNCHAFCLCGRLPPAPLPRLPPAARGPRSVEAVPPARSPRPTATQGARPGPPPANITLNVPTGAVLTVESERPVTYTLYRARHDERARRPSRASAR